MNNTIQYNILKIPINLIIESNFKINLKDKEAILYTISQMDSLFLDQLRRITNKSIYDTNIKDVLLIECKRSKSPKVQEALNTILDSGFDCNNVHYVRFGKSASQAKEGITLFVNELIYDELFLISQQDIQIGECVISKYESYRNLILSTCTLIKNTPLPHICIIDEYTKILPNQYIRYVKEDTKEIVDKQSGENKTIPVRSIEEGYKDIKISPFDGCGCHTKELSELWSRHLNLDYKAIGFQIRLPFLKGYSVEMPFREYYHSLGIFEITDVFGQVHSIDEIDCIWNITMWKAYSLFKETYGNKGFNEYIKTLNKYQFTIGITKYSHHIKDINIKTRMNFQYLQCLNLWNQKYIDWFNSEQKQKYDILNTDNWSNTLKLASYTTNLYEKIIKGDKFYSCRFLGIDDSEAYSISLTSKYLSAVMINDVMLKDPAIKGFIYRKLKKIIEESKFGKIYVDGFYHTCVGDMIAYLEYACGIPPIGCLNDSEFYCDTTIPKNTSVLSFRSPLVCPSEVNQSVIIENKLTDRWFSHFKDQDVVMINMYDLTLPQMGGMDEDGDAFLICSDSLLSGCKIDKPITIDIEDKVTVKKKLYNKENLIKYEINTRDNRIGEITNVATSILNQYVSDDKWKKINEDNVSLLRLQQGKEIDYLKTGVRWHLNSWMRKYAKKLPYFLLYRYPDKLNTYHSIQRRNKTISNKSEKIPINIYHSPSPLNELCEYILTWEKKKIVWDKTCYNTSCLILNQKLELNDQQIIRAIRRIFNLYSNELRKVLSKKEDSDRWSTVNILSNYILNELKQIINNDDELLANYCIKTAYLITSTNKAIVWYLFGDYILKNLRNNTPINKSTKIIETTEYNPNAYEYLGKYYEMIEGYDAIV